MIVHLVVNLPNFMPGKTTSISLFLTARTYLYGLIWSSILLLLLTLLILLGLLLFLIVVFFVLSEDLDEFKVDWISWTLRNVVGER